MMIWSREDQAYIDEVTRLVERQARDKSEQLLQTTDFFDRLYEDPLYIYHFEPEYWADYVLHEDVEKLDRP